MRHKFENILDEELCYLAIETRDGLNLTQKEMGELLQMGEIFYSNLETGDTICASAPTPTLLLRMQEDPSVFLNRVAERFDEALQPI